MSTPERSVTFFRVVVVILALLSTLKPVRHVLGVLKVAGQSASHVAGASMNPQYARKEQELRAKGIPTRLVDLDRPLPPAAENAGPIYLKLASAIDPDGTGRSAKSKAITQAETAGMTVYTSTAKAKPADWQAAVQYANRYQNLITLAEQAARRRHCVISRVTKNVDPASIKFPEYKAMRDGGRDIAIKSCLMAKNGNYPGAVDEQALGFRIADHAQADMGNNIALLVALACDAITLKGYRDILTISHGDTLTVRRIDAIAARDWKRRDAAEALKNDVAMGNEEIHYLALSGGRGWVWAGICDRNGTLYLDRMERSIAAAKLPYPHSKADLENIEREVDKDKLPVDFLALMVESPYPSIAEKTVTVESEAAITRAVCDVFLYKSKHGAYPLTLADATSTATDPFDGKPLGYRRTAKGFVVYSVGPTGKYDGGDFDSKKQHEEVYRYSNDRQ